MSNAALKPSLDETLISTNPSRNFEVLGEVAFSTETEIKDKVTAARAAFPAWQALNVEQRVEHLRGLLEIFRSHRDALIQKTAAEMGMPMKLATTVVDGGLEEFQWNCDNAVEALSAKIVYEDVNEVNEVTYEPFGVVASVLPWNFPFPNFARSPAMALLAGNTVVIKYSEEIALFAKFMEDVIAGSDLPDGIVHFIFGDGRAGDVLTDQDIDFITFTGSSKTGQYLYKKAADKLIPVELELGGSSPGVVFTDANLDETTIETIWVRRFSNSGQFCSGLKRLIVHNSRMEEVTKKLVALTATKIVGDAQDPNTDLGPLVAERQVTQLEDQIQDACDKGATILCGGKRPDGVDGAYFEPTLITNITKDMKVWHEEVFGPALAIIGFDTYEEAIELANDTIYGLSGFVFTTDTELAKRAMRDIQVGSIQQNSCNYQRPQNPFGGFKASGIGRQRGITGFHNMCQAKVIAWSK